MLFIKYHILYVSRQGIRRYGRYSLFTLCHVPCWGYINQLRHGGWEYCRCTMETFFGIFQVRGPLKECKLNTQSHIHHFNSNLQESKLYKTLVEEEKEPFPGAKMLGDQGYKVRKN